MTDIVERLRAIKKLPLDLQTVAKEAADEIERERKAHLELAASYHDATEEIERLRSYRDSIASVQNRLEVVEVENAKLRKALELQKQASRDVAATYTEQETEIERLEHMQANLHGHIKRLEDEIERLRIERDFCAAENAKLQKYKEAHARIVEIEAIQERRIDEAEAENAKLNAENASLDGALKAKVKRRDTGLEAENAKLREALLEIRDTISSQPVPRDIARAALQKDAE